MRSVPLRDLRALLLLPLVLGLLPSCANRPVFVAGPAAMEPSPELGQAGYSVVVEPGYILRPTDVVSVNVFREQGLSVGSVALSADGQISLPLVGAVNAAGMTPPQLEERIETLLSERYLRNPDVMVNVLQYASHQVTVEGAVGQAGVFDFRPGWRLSSAIARAEGVSRVADANNVAIFRRTTAGMQVARFDYAAVQAGNMLDPVLHPEDRVVVGTNGLSQLWQDVLRAIPVLGVFTNI